MHQFDHFEQLVRRVGYSVGLEHVVDRVEVLANVYFEKREMNLAIWKSLVQDEYGRKISDDLVERTWVGARKSQNKLGAEDHFANFYGQLNLLTKVENQVMPLFGLDILSILKGSLASDLLFNRALKILLTLYLFEADGDIFLNCVISDFDKDLCAAKIFHMFQHKKEAYFRAFNSIQARERLATVFTVQSSKASPSEYLDKVLPTRKGWYEQLTLPDLVGRASLSSFFRDQGILIDDQFCAFFLYSDAHRKLFIREGVLGVKEVARLDFTRDLITLLSVKGIPPDELDREDAIELLKEILEAYKTTNSTRGMLRHQIPLYVVFPCYYLISILRYGKFLDLQNFLDKETLRAEGRILDVTNLRGSEGALSIK